MDRIQEERINLCRVRPVGGLYMFHARRSLLLTGAVLAVLLAGGWLAPAVRAQAQPEPEGLSPQEKQKQVQADTDFVVRRVATTLRVLEYYKLDKASEKKMLEEVAVT